MPPHRPLSDSELERLDEPALVRHMHAMREAGEGEAAVRAMWVLLWRRLGWIRKKLELKMPPDVAEEHAMSVVERAARAKPFDGTTGGELTNWLKTIISREVADFYRGAGGRRLDAGREAERRLGPEDGPAREQGADDGGFDLVADRDIIDRVLGSRSPEHRKAIELGYFGRYPAKEVAAATGLGEDNVYQVIRRFKLDCRASDPEDAT